MVIDPTRTARHEDGPVADLWMTAVVTPDPPEEGSDQV